EKAKPGDSVQIDVKVVKIGGTKIYPYTACDDCTHLRVLRLYRRLNRLSSLDFLNQVLEAFPFPIRKIQTDRAGSSRSPSCSPWSGERSASATPSRGARIRTARSSAATGSTWKSSGSGTPSTRSMRRRRL